jgi:hypothetical protein
MIPEQDKGSGLARNHSGESQTLTGTEGAGRKADSLLGRDEGSSKLIGISGSPWAFSATYLQPIKIDLTY